MSLKIFLLWKHFKVMKSFFWMFFFYLPWVDPLRTTEIKSHRTGLTTKFELWCRDSERCSKTERYTAETTRKVFSIYRKMVLGFHLIGKGFTAASKVKSVLGLANPINTASFANYTLNLEKVLPKLWLSVWYRQLNYQRKIKMKTTLMSRKNVQADQVKKE